MDLALQVGEVTENVSVTGQVARLETEQGRVSGTIERRQLTDLPINGRNLYGLIALQPGVTGKGLRFGGGLDSNAPIAGGTTVQANANGQRTDSNNFTVDDASVNSPADGGSARLTPNAESVDEVRVVTNNFSAVEGRNSGAQVQVITKSGTNQLHGAVLEDFTNNTLSTRNVFEGASVPVFRRNEFGYNVGGPIVKNRTFFFHSFEGLRGSGGRGTVATVETAAFRDFILRTRPNSIAAKLLGNSRPLLYPDQNLRDLGSPAPGVNVIGPNDGILDIGNVQYVPDTRRNGEQYSARIDHELRPGKDRLYGNFYYTPSVSLSGGVRPDFDRPTIKKTYYVGLNETHIFDPSKINEFRAGMMRINGLFAIPKHLEIPTIQVPPLAGFGDPGGAVSRGLLSDRVYL